MKILLLLSFLISRVCVVAADIGPNEYRAVLSQARQEIPFSSDEHSPRFTYLEFVVLEPSSFDGVVIQLFMRPSTGNDELFRGFAPLLWTTRFFIELNPTSEGGASVTVRIDSHKEADLIPTAVKLVEHRFTAEIYQRSEVPLAKAEVAFENTSVKRTIELPKGFLPPMVRQKTLEVMSVSVKKFTPLNSEAKKEISLFILTEQSSGMGGKKVPFIISHLGKSAIIYYENVSVRNGFLSVNELKYLAENL
jgi:hypothetical protein